MGSSLLIAWSRYLELLNFLDFLRLPLTFSKKHARIIPESSMSRSTGPFPSTLWFPSLSCSLSIPILKFARTLWRVYPISFLSTQVLSMLTSTHSSLAFSNEPPMRSPKFAATFAKRLSFSLRHAPTNFCQNLVTLPSICFSPQRTKMKS